MPKRKVALILSAIAAVVMAVGGAGPAAAQNQAGDSLVNVQVGDVTVELPIAIAANVCDTSVNVLAQQTDVGPATCTAVANPTATPPQGPGGHQNNAGNSLVNVQIGDVTILAPIGIAANICDTDVNVLAEQNKLGRTTCTAQATPTA
jgi:hypothetical protein